MALTLSASKALAVSAIMGMIGFSSLIFRRFHSVHHTGDLVFLEDMFH